MNEVTREDNQVLGKTVVYNYDAGGNITSKVQYAYTTGTLGTATSTINYSYGDSNWKDKLTSYNGKAITYDQIGNPLNDGNYNYTWEEGRQLSGISGNGKTIAYKYNDAGIRTQKVVNGVTTDYHLEGDKVTYESNGTDKIYYTYDSEGKLLSMNLNGTEYYYIRNAQGDIIGLFDKNGAAVASYTYDTWGKLISIKDGSGTDITNNTTSVGYKNAYRYRGYRYDTETGLYYLNARYYNAEWGRFINADAYGGKVGNLLSHNAFAYSMNNPVNISDPSGNWPSLSGIIKAVKNVVNTVVNVVVKVTTVVVNTVKSVASSIMNNPYLKGSASGGLDKAVEKKAEKYIPETTRGFVSTGKLTLQKYVTTPGVAARVSKVAAKRVGAATIAFTAKDILTSVSNKQYKGAILDLASGFAGVLIGAGIGVGVTIAVSAGLPLVIAGAIGFGINVFVSAQVDKYVNKRKEEIYGS